MPTELATAYISLVPSFKGGKAAIAKELGPAEAAAGKSGAQSGSKFAGAMKGAMLGPAIFAGVGVGVLKVGSDFASAYKTIRVGTGETGKALDGLKGDFKAVLSERPDNMNDVAKAITGVKKATGTTGKPLQELTKTYLRLSGITGTDLAGNLKSTSQLFTNYGIDAAKQGPKLDILYRASQKGQLSVSELAASMTKAGPVGRQLGLDFDHTAGLVALLSKAGVDIGEVMPAMTRTIKNAAKEGKDAGQVFRATFKQIAGAKTDTAAAGLAVDAFGAKAGPKLAGLIREGKLSYADFVAQIKNGKDTIASSAKDTGTMSGKLKTLKNSFLVAIEPLASGAFTKANELLVKWGPIITKIVQRGAHMPGWVRKTVIAVVALGVASKVLGKVHSGITRITGAAKSMAGAVGKAKGFFTSTGSSGYSKIDRLRMGFMRAREAGSKLWTGVKSGATTLAGYAKTAASTAVSIAKTTGAWLAQKAALIASKVATIATTVAEKAAAVAQWALNMAMSANPITLIVIAIAALVAGLVLAYKKIGWFHDFVNAVGRRLKAIFVGAIDFIRDHWKAILAILTGPIGLAVGVIVTHWDKIKAGFRIVRDFIVGRVTDIVHTITGIGGRIASAVSTVWNGLTGGISLAKTFIHARINDVVGFVKDLPARLGRGAKRITDVLLAPFRLAFKGIAKLWNATIGKIHFKTPSWVPGFGGKGFSFPTIDLDKFHSGGVVPGRSEVPILAMGGERVLTKTQNRAYERAHTRPAPSTPGGTHGMFMDHPTFIGATAQEIIRQLQVLLLQQAHRATVLQP